MYQSEYVSEWFKEVRLCERVTESERVSKGWSREVRDLVKGSTKFGCVKSEKSEGVS